jgi:L-arabinose isomerase
MQIVHNGNCSHIIVERSDEATLRKMAAAEKLYAALVSLREHAMQEITRGGAHHHPCWAMTADALALAEGKTS